MKLKYYLRGLGIGIILTTIILTISYSGRELELTDEEIIQRAEALGMVMEEDSLFPNKNKEDEPKVENSTENIIETEQDILKENSEVISEQETVIENSQEMSESENIVENSETVTESETVIENNEIISESENKNKETTSEDTMKNSETVSEQEYDVVNSETLSEDGNSVTDNEDEVYRLMIYPGYSANSISRELERNGVIADRKELAQYLAEVGYSRMLLVGEYEIPYGSTLEEIYEILKAGPL